jgi:hypothetical protein
MTSLFLSTSTHYPGKRLRNHLVPWSPHASMVGFLAFKNGFISFPPNWKIPSSVRIKLINSHSLDCTRLPWDSLTSMVIFLTLVDGFH